MGAFCISSKTSTVRDHASITTSSAVPNLFFFENPGATKGRGGRIGKEGEGPPPFFFFFFFFL